MGGLGSGHQGWSKPVAEHQRQLRMADLRRQGALNPGTFAALSWSRPDGSPWGSLGVKALSDNAIELHYTRTPQGGEPEQVRETIKLDKTACNYGGDRPWFVCPDCYRRRGVLYCGPRGFICRECAGLSYRTRNIGTEGRLFARIARIRRQLGWPQGVASGNHWGKPKWMHYRTFERLCREHEALADAATDRLWATFERIRGKAAKGTVPAPPSG